MRRHEEVPAEDIPLDIIYEDRWLVVVNKPPDLVVHPSKGHQTGTLVNALVHHFDELSQVYGPLRPGVVHRLDRDTSGVMLVIKDDAVHESIARQFEQRTVSKQYVAVVEGRVELDADLIDAPIGRHRGNREKMAIQPTSGKPAQTVYEVIERLGRYTVVRCMPKTGRTHQIRVHLLYLGHPIVADSLYSGRSALYLSDLTRGEHAPDEEPLIHRQALHARRITIRHPMRDEEMTFEAPLPGDMTRLIEALREHAG
jgi:23S rRNA pseudouridine1911/1915/1917 synthase